MSYLISFFCLIEFSHTPEVISNLQANTLYWRECAEREQLQILQQKMQAQIEATTNFNHKIVEDSENEVEIVTFLVKQK